MKRFQIVLVFVALLGGTGGLVGVRLSDPVERVEPVAAEAATTTSIDPSAANERAFQIATRQERARRLSIPTTTTTTAKPRPKSPPASRPSVGEVHASVTASGPPNIAKILECIRGPWHGKSQESNGRYEANNYYKGAYQFLQSTWNAVAKGHFPEMTGKNPALVAPADQDKMATFLIGDVGLGKGFTGQWPHRGECRTAN